MDKCPKCQHYWNANRQCGCIANSPLTDEVLVTCGSTRTQRCISHYKSNSPEAFISMDINEGWTILCVIDCGERVLVLMERW